MRFYRLVKNDIKNGFASNYLHYAAIAAIVLVSCIDMHIRVRNSYYLEDVIPEITIADMLLYLFSGIPEFIPDRTEIFIFPVRWFFLMMMLLYGGLYFPYRDLHTIGVNVLVRSGSRSKWWFSKCIWILFDQIAAYLCIGITLLLFGIVSRTKFSLKITPEIVNNIMQAGSPYDCFPVQIVIMTLTLPFLTTLALCIWQNVISLFVKPIFSYLAIAIIVLTSAYLMNFIFIGNFAMAIRSTYFVPDGYQPSWGYSAAFIAAAAGLIVGMMRLRKYDILSVEH